MNKIRNNVYVYLGFLVAFCAVILFGIFLGPQYPSVFFWGIIVLALGSICLYFSPSLRDLLDLALRALALSFTASLLDSEPFGWLLIGFLFVLTGQKLMAICSKRLPR